MIHWIPFHYRNRNKEIILPINSLLKKGNNQEHIRNTFQRKPYGMGRLGSSEGRREGRVAAWLRCNPRHLTAFPAGSLRVCMALGS